MPETGVNTCVRGETLVLAFPHQPTMKNAAGAEVPATLRPWTLVVCAGCYANEIMPMPFDESTAVDVKFPKEVWKRLHGFTRIYRVNDAQGISHEQRQFVPSTWSDRECVSLLEAKVRLDSGTGKDVTRTFLTVDFFDEAKRKHQEQVVAEDAT